MKLTVVVKTMFVPWRAYLAEFLGTYILVFISLGLVLVDVLYQNLEPVSIALSLGFVYAALLFMTVHLSGGFLNPAITVGLWFAKKLSGDKALFFLISQVLASFLAGASIRYFFGKKSLDFSLGLAPISQENLQMAIILEVIFTTVLVFGVFSSMVDKGGPASFGPLVIGFLSVALSVFAFPISGAIFNPAKVIGPAIISANYNILIVGVIGPLSASLFGFFYDFAFIRRATKPHS